MDAGQCQYMLPVIIIGGDLYKDLFDRSIVGIRYGNALHNGNSYPETIGLIPRSLNGRGQIIIGIRNHYRWHAITGKYSKGKKLLVNRRTLITYFQYFRTRIFIV